MAGSESYVHPTAIVETAHIGAGTRIWAFAHVMRDVSIGDDCNVGDHVFIEDGARVGCGVTIKNNALIWRGVHLGNYVFVGPGVVFTNDRYPRSPRHPDFAAASNDPSRWLLETHVEEGASVGANATILPGVRLGAYCVIGAGAVVTADVAPYALVLGNPGRVVGSVDRFGRRGR